jgi:hypothetical protein
MESETGKRIGSKDAFWKALCPERESHYVDTIAYLAA